MLREFLRALTARWFITMGGGLGVPGTAIGAFFTTGMYRAAFVVLAVVALFSTAYWVWREERVRVMDLQRLLDPRLTLSFEPDQEPFVALTTQNYVEPPENHLLYVRVLARCGVQVNNCRGVLNRVLKLEGDQ